jgi:DNA-directed RNA polymerase specialized sigma subunit
MYRFYKLNPLQVGSGSIAPDDFIIYTDDNVPSELQEALDAETIANELASKIAEYKAYLEATDFKMTVDYDEDVVDVKLKRQEAREFIRANESKE